MTPTQVEFTSRIDKWGYKIVDAKRPPRKGGQTEREWLLDTPFSDARIIGLGGGKRLLHLANNHPFLFSKFAKATTETELLSFITEYGPLTKENEILQLIDEAKRMKACLRENRYSDFVIADMRATIASRKGSVSIKYRPATLLDALWLQLGQALSGGDQIKQCKQCGDWFPVGKSAGKRIVARFCADKCRIEYNSLERTRKKRSRGR
jgi:hypothetical protein